MIIPGVEVIKLPRLGPIDLYSVVVEPDKLIEPGLHLLRLDPLCSPIFGLSIVLCGNDELRAIVRGAHQQPDIVIGDDWNLEAVNTAPNVVVPVKRVTRQARSAQNAK